MIDINKQFWNGTLHFYAKTVYPFFFSFIVQLCVYDFS